MKHLRTIKTNKPVTAATVSWYGPVLVAVVISVLYFLFHLHFMQQFNDNDQYVYERNIYLDIQDIRPTMYNPHHLHFEITGKLFHNAVKSVFGKYGLTNLAFNLRLRSLLTACAGIFFLFLYLYDITKKYPLSVFGTMLTAFTHGYLSYATKIDTGIFSLTAFILVMFITRKIEISKKGTIYLAVIGGIVLFIAIMAHQFLAIACVIACVTIGLPPYLFPKKNPFSPFSIHNKNNNPGKIDLNPKARYSAAVLMAFLGIILTVGAYFCAGKSQYKLPFGNPGPSESIFVFQGLSFQQWLFFYEYVGDWGTEIDTFNPKDPFRGFTDSFLSQTEKPTHYNRNHTFMYDIDTPLIKSAFTHNQFAYFTIGVLFLGLFLIPGLWKMYGRTIFFVLSNFGLYTAFSSYWESFYYEFWLIPALLFILLGVFLLHFLTLKLKHFFSSFSEIPVLSYALYFLIIISSHNMLYYTVPFSRERQGEGIYWIEDKTWRNRVYHEHVYKHPENVYRGIYPPLPDDIYGYSSSGK